MRPTLQGVEFFSINVNYNLASILPDKRKYAKHIQIKHILLSQTCKSYLAFKITYLDISLRNRAIHLSLNISHPHLQEMRVRLRIK